MATACTASPASSTGRRPVWSDSLPKVSRPASTASAYTPNTTVVASGENPQCAAYSAYIGVGAADAARNETTIEPSSTSDTPCRGRAACPRRQAVQAHSARLVYALPCRLHASLMVILSRCRRRAARCAASRRHTGQTDLLCSALDRPRPDVRTNRPAGVCVRFR